MRRATPASFGSRARLAVRCRSLGATTDRVRGRVWLLVTALNDAGRDRAGGLTVGALATPTTRDHVGRSGPRRDGRAAAGAAPRRYMTAATLTDLLDREKDRLASIPAVTA
jgi:hypothetical protein